MEVAIEEVLPGTKHLWCKWHILRKAKEQLGHLYSKKSKTGFKEDFHKLINTMLIVSEFEAGWKHMLQKYKLQKMTTWTRYTGNANDGQSLILKTYSVQNKLALNTVKAGTA